MSSNKTAKERLIKLYGEKDFLDALHIKLEPKRKYKSKGQLKRMKQLSYHHIIMKKDGGPATVENGALLTVEHHQLFHQLPQNKQDELNNKFQEYKKNFDKVSVELVDQSMEELAGSAGISINFSEFSPEEPKKIKYNRGKERANLQKIREEWVDR